MTTAPSKETEEKKDNHDKNKENKEDEKDKSKTWAERWNTTKTVFVNIPGALKLVWEAHPGATVALAVMTLANALLPAGQAWAGKLIVDSVVHSINTKQAVGQAFA